MDQDPVITLALPLSVVNQALTALAELPAKISMAAIREMQRQTVAWLQANEEPTALVANEEPTALVANDAEPPQHVPV